MITRIREVRRARGMTLDDVARKCDPPTTPQTIGRLETGTRTVSVGWLNRIAAALGVEAQDLVDGGDSAELKVAALVGQGGATAPKRAAIVVTPRIEDGDIAIIVAASVGDRVVAAAALSGAFHPAPANEPTLLELVQGGVEGCEVEGQLAVGALFDRLDQLVAVAGLVFEKRQDQELGAALLGFADRASGLHGGII